MILNKILNNLEMRPRAIIVLGAPKSGKTLWLEEWIERNRVSNYINLNIEKFNNPHERSDIFENCLDSKKNFIYEGIVLKEDRINNLINKIKEHNYRITLVHVKKDLGTILEDIDDKKFSSKVESLYKKTTNIVAKFKDKVDRVIEVQ